VHNRRAEVEGFNNRQGEALFHAWVDEHARSSDDDGEVRFAQARQCAHPTGFEAGLIGTGALHTTLERVSRSLCSAKLPGATAQATLDTQLAIYARFLAHAVASVTADNGSEFTWHYRLADTIGVPTYFADPNSASLRGTNEHVNGRLRKYLPKRTSFADLDQAELDEIITEINNRPGKILGWATLAEVFNELCSQQATHTCYTSCYNPGVTHLDLTLVGLSLLITCFLLIPGWDQLAHLLLLDRVPIARYRLAFGMVSFVLLVLCADRSTASGNWSLSRMAKILVLASAFGLSLIGIVWFAKNADLGVGAMLLISVPAVIFIVSLALFLGKRLVSGSALLVLANILSKAQINPVYSGVFDLRTTELVLRIQTLDADRQGVWVALSKDTSAPTVALVESGVTQLNGFQVVPSVEMWKMIDPTQAFQNSWNRPANVEWSEGEGEPAISNPAADSILVSFDACSVFAKKHVNFVVSDYSIQGDRCLIVRDVVVGESRKYWILDVVKS
jgi:IS30 family transposase